MSEVIPLPLYTFMACKRQSHICLSATR